MSVPKPLRQGFWCVADPRLGEGTKGAAQARRRPALAGIYDGGTRSEVAKIGGVELQIIRD
jgi:hypothetical protein